MKTVKITSLALVCCCCLTSMFSLPPVVAQDIITPEPKIISDSDKRSHWTYLYKPANLLEKKAVAAIDTSSQFATIKTIGSEQKKMSNWRKEDLDNLWGKGKRVNEQLYRYKLLTEEARKDSKAYQIDAKFENGIMVAYEISGRKIAKLRWVDVQK